MQHSTQDRPVNQREVGGGHPPTEGGEGIVISRERGKLSQRLGLLLQLGFFSLACSTPGETCKLLTLRVETCGPRLDLTVFKFFWK